MLASKTKEVVKKPGKRSVPALRNNSDMAVITSVTNPDAKKRKSVASKTLPLESKNSGNTMNGSSNFDVYNYFCGSFIRVEVFSRL